MKVPNSSGIGFKLFGMFILLASAVFVDLIIISDGVIINNIEDMVNYFDEDYVEVCDYTFSYLDNEKYGLVNESDINSQMYLISSLVEELETNGRALYDDIYFKYQVNFCDTMLVFDDDMDVIFYEKNATYYDATPYKDTLKVILEEGILRDSLVHFYKGESNFLDENDRPIRYDLEVSYEDANRLIELWNQSKNNVVEWPFETDADYYLVIGRDLIIFDNFGGRVYYNGNHVQVPDEMMDILREYI